MPTWSGPKQQALPFPYRGQSLWRGCRWAVNMSPWRGRTQVGSRIDKDSQSKNTGFISGTPGTTMSKIRYGGRTVNSNGAQTGIVWQDYVKIPVPQEGIYSWLNGGGMSLACLFHFRSIPGGPVRCLTKRFGRAPNFHGGALSFDPGLGNRFTFTWCDGANVEFISAPFAAAAGITYLLVGRHWGNNGNIRAELWVNGKREAVNAAPAVYPFYHSDPPITFFNDTGSGDGTANAEAFMGALWARPLSQAEIQKLTVNPFVMWDSPPSPMGLPFGGGGAFNGCPCCGSWLQSWNGLG